MGLFDFWIKKRKEDISENKEKEYTLLDLAKSGDTFWKFSRSSEEVPCVENLYAEYVPGKITVAKDAEKKLSFVPSAYAGTCSMYGDQLTEFNFDLHNPKFQEIANNPVKIWGNAFHEHETEQLLVKQNYSLADIETVKKVIEMGNEQSIRILICNPLDPSWERYDKLGFVETKAFLQYLWKTYNEVLCEKDALYIKNNIDNIIRDFSKQKVYSYSCRKGIEEQISEAKATMQYEKTSTHELNRDKER